MKYYLPDSQDLVDPSFDFEKESRSIQRIRQRDDRYAHEVFSTPAYDGVLVSKGIVDGTGGSGGRYSMAQRHRLLRVGVHDFFRLEGGYRDKMPIMGDCGAFTYVKEEVPPYSVDEVLDFYDDCGFDAGISVDHVILGYDERLDEPGADSPPQDFVNRQELTLALAEEFLKTHKSLKLRFKPIAVAHGWSPASYARAVTELQKMGYDYIAVGGMVPLKTPQILASLEAIAKVRKRKTKLHLLGITRVENVGLFHRYGAVSFDSTSPLRQAFKDDKDNYYTPDRTYVALRLPQVEGNARLQKKIRAGKVNQNKAIGLERACRDAMKAFDTGKGKAAEVAKLLVSYEQLLGARKDMTEAYTEVLEAAPWKDCPCDVCQALGHHVIIFRGAERNRRRGFHNVWVFYRRLQRELGLAGLAATGRKSTGQKRRRATA